MNNVLNKIFNKDKNIIIGAIHFPPLFGYKDFPGIDVALKNALHDLRAFEEGGADGIIIENIYVVPHKISVDKETVEMMILLGKKIKEAAKIPIGVSVLWNDYKSALFIAKKIGAQFIRVPVFVDSARTNYGDVIANPESILKYRKKIGAEDVAIFTDIHVKHAELLGKRTIGESAGLAIEKGSDALIITGKWTGDAPDIKDLKNVRSRAKNFPILIGSGADATNIKKLLKYANGAIVSTSLKEGGVKKEEINVKAYQQRIDIDKVKIFIGNLK